MNPHWHNLFARLQESDGAAPLPLRALASGLAALYGLGARARRELYARGLLKARRLPAPVVSVGNLTVGGTGKTPVTAWLARRLQESGQARGHPQPGLRRPTPRRHPAVGRGAASSPSRRR